MTEYHPESLSNIYGLDRTSGFTMPPAPPFKYVNWLGVESKHSKQLKNDYQIYMQGWNDAINSYKSLQMKI